MADPDHVAMLDSFDRLTVKLYRSGLGLSAFAVMALGLLLDGAGSRSTDPGVSDPERLASVGVVVGGACAAANIHLYDKRVRWAIVSLAWAGALVVLLGSSVHGAPPVIERVVHLVGLGLVFAALSAIALKEDFCFRVPLVKGAPVLFVGSLLLWLVLQRVAAGAAMTVAGCLLGWLTWVKLRQPLHYDVGDKARYQV